MMLYKNTKVKVRSLDGDTDYFDIVAGVLQGGTWAPRAWNVYRFNKRKRFQLARERSRRYPAQTITDADYASGKLTRPSRIPVT